MICVPGAFHHPERASGSCPARIISIDRRMAHFRVLPAAAVNSCITLLPVQNPIIMAKALSTGRLAEQRRITVTSGRAG